MYFRQTNPYFKKKIRILDKQTASSNTIKHQRDKQIIFVHPADIQLFKLFKLFDSYQYSSSLKKKSSFVG